MTSTIETRTARPARKKPDPQRPLEMPQGTTRPAGTSPSAPGASPTNPIPVPPSGMPGGASPPVNVNPAVRNIEKIEK